MEWGWGMDSAFFQGSVDFACCPVDIFTEGFRVKVHRKRCPVLPLLVGAKG
jgi:hypothetical protein